MSWFVNAAKSLCNNEIIYPVAIIVFGTYITIKTKFFHFRLFFPAIKNILKENRQHEEKAKHHKDQISPIKSFFLQIATTIGIGTISGSMLALYFGGPGSIFWILVFGILISGQKFGEIILAKKFTYKNKDDGSSNGGIFYILKNSVFGKNSKIGALMGFTYAIILYISIHIWSSFQMNQGISVFVPEGLRIGQSIVKGGISASMLLSLLLSITIGLMLCLNVKKISSIMSSIVPVMVTVYFCIVLSGILFNLEASKEAIKEVMRCAFTFKSSMYGFGAVLSTSISRAVLSTEAGLGTATIINSMSSEEYPARQAFLGALETMIVTVMLALGSLMFLVLGCNSQLFSGILPNDIKISLVQGLIYKNLGIFGYVGFAAIIGCFSLTTLIGNGYYVKSSADFLFNNKINKKLVISLYAIGAFSISLIKGVDSIVTIIDNLNKAMIVMNLIMIIKLMKHISIEAKKYYTKLKPQENKV
ncbi:alanine:cation symporter family protein [Rickettsiales bacterium]|nr:alanine:cation symporter family protein [Rickettsiales bacterium]